VVGQILVEAGTEKVKVNTPIALLLAEGEKAGAPAVSPATDWMSMRVWGSGSVSARAGPAASTAATRTAPMMTRRIA
jgi:pyruvate/2-oxoglutarate dehydrogenase complex dihydrolipoamide acyltransferase (E2) component